VGAAGFLIDAGVLQLLVIEAKVNAYIARIVSFLLAASVTWILNRRFTFRVRHRASHGEWIRYLSLMVLGATVNYGIYALCIMFWSEARAHPWYGVAAGSIMALGLNFTSSRLLFRRSLAE
jgi:putative flippase GtrA